MTGQHPVIHVGAKVRRSSWVGCVTVTAVGRTAFLAEARNGYENLYSIDDAWLPYTEPPPPCPEIRYPWRVFFGWEPALAYPTEELARDAAARKGAWVIELKAEDAVYVPPKEAQ